MKKIVFAIILTALICYAAGCADINTANEDTSAISSSASESDNISNSSETKEVTEKRVRNAPETDSSLFICEDVDGGVSITDYNGTEEIVSIPKSINGKDVVSIGEYSFANDETIRGLKIPDTVVSIGESAFGNCYELEVFISGNSLKEIGSYAFNYCKKLYQAELNDGLESLKAGAFTGTAIREVYVPSSVVIIEGPFIATGKETITIIGERGSEMEKYVEQYGEVNGLVFNAK